MWREFPLKDVPALQERAEHPLPKGKVPAGTRPVVAVNPTSRHPSDGVIVLFRRDGGPAQILRAAPVDALGSGVPGLFKANLPAVSEGQRIDYRVELVRAGQRLTSLPLDGSWRSFTGAAPTREAPTQRESPVTSTGTSDGSSVGPRFGYDLKFFARLTANLRAEILGATPEGYRINFFVKGGSVVGPGIDAVIQPEGGDWMCIRPDGIGAVNIKITYETQDGALVLEQSGGIFDIGTDGYQKVVAGEFTGAPPFYATPTWATSHPNWTWLNRCQGFGIGRVVMEKLQVQCDIYMPEVLARLGHG